MARFPQCPRCGDNLSELVGPTVPHPAYPEGLCTVCAAEFTSGAEPPKLSPVQEYALPTPALTELVNDPDAPAKIVGRDDVQERLSQAAASVAVELGADMPTLRDRFAAVSLPPFVKHFQAAGQFTPEDQRYVKAARCAYQQANAMIDARSAPSELAALREEVAKLRAFKRYVHDRLDAAGIEENPPGKHADAGCRVGQRLSVAFRKFGEFAVFVSMLTRAGIGHGLRPDYENEQPAGTSVQVENSGDDSGEFITEFQFNEADKLVSVHCYPHQPG